MVVAQRSMQYTRVPQIVGRGPNLGRETLHSGSRNNLNLHSKFAILIKCDNSGLPFHVLSFIKFCARKLLLPIVGLVLKFISNYRVFSTKLYAHKMLGSWEFRTNFGALQKVFGGPCNIQTMRATGKNTLQALVTSWKNGMGSYSRHRGKEQGIKPVTIRW